MRSLSESSLKSTGKWDLLLKRFWEERAQTCWETFRAIVLSRSKRIEAGVSVRWGNHHFSHRPEAPQQNVVRSQLRRLEVQDAGVSRAGSLRGLLLDLHTTFLGLFLCVQIASSYKDTGQTRFQPTIRTSFCLQHLFQGLISKYSPILRHWGQDFNLGICGKTTQPITPGNEGERDPVTGHCDVQFP